MVKQILVTVLSGILVWLITWGILSDKILNGKNDFSEQPINQNENHKKENSYELEKVRNAREEAEAKARKAEEAAHKLEIEKERIAREEAEARARKAEEAARKLEIEKEQIAREETEARARKAENNIVHNFEVGYVCKLNPNGDNFLSLREGPGTFYPEILRIGGNTVLNFLEVRKPWYHVRMNNGITGWVHSHWICQGSP